MYKKGDKVRPLRKTVGTSWDLSYTIAGMKSRKQDFLYVIKEYPNGTVTCSFGENCESSGDFHITDIEPYESFELVIPESEEGTSNTLELSRYLMLELLQKDFFKEDVRFYVSK